MVPYGQALHEETGEKKETCVQVPRSVRDRRELRLWKPTVLAESPDPARHLTFRSQVSRWWGHQREQRLRRFIRVFQPPTDYCHREEGTLCPTKQSFLPWQKIASPLRARNDKRSNDKIASHAAGRGQVESKSRLFRLKKSEVINGQTFFNVLKQQNVKFRIKTILFILSSEQQYISQLPASGHFDVTLTIYASVIGIQSQRR